MIFSFPLSSGNRAVNSPWNHTNLTRIGLVLVLVLVFISLCVGCAAVGGVTGRGDRPVGGNDRGHRAFTLSKIAFQLTRSTDASISAC